MLTWRLRGRCRPALTGAGAAAAAEVVAAAPHRIGSTPPRPRGGEHRAHRGAAMSCCASVDLGCPPSAWIVCWIFGVGSRSRWWVHALQSSQQRQQATHKVQSAVSGSLGTCSPALRKQAAEAPPSKMGTVPRQRTSEGFCMQGASCHGCCPWDAWGPPACAGLCLSVLASAAVVSVCMEAGLSRRSSSRPLGSRPEEAVCLQACAQSK